LEEMYFVPYAEILLTHLALETRVLVMDGSVLIFPFDALSQ